MNDTRQKPERQLMSGMLSNGTTFRLLVAGEIGASEIEWLIRKLELDKAILADARMAVETRPA